MSRVAMEKVALFGATSTIVEMVGRYLAESGELQKLFLVGRDEERLRAIASDLSLRSGADVELQTYDFSENDGIEALSQAALNWLGEIDLAIIGYGYLEQGDNLEMDAATAAQTMQINYSSRALLALNMGQMMAKRGKGCIVGLSSVAGDRGRGSNFVYGSSKAGFATFLDGLRNRLQPLGVQVLTVKPGFVDTAMTADMVKNKLFASPEEVARDIVSAVRRRRNSLYTPWFWRWIMTLIRLIPEPIFKRLKL